ncbi:hypothetical protein M409DRAFT_17901 [Zasmidium cellare ATCC 36951]|uniref:Uncharacterized protein n=1 Tax=Zasmidium cellare ATCC 36951 TaxID=1080233 RepID=A0A6A6CX01_ZASCE|nr:uncharacterized protein M409DRAFT_17901 [Zasmidium cellare ATCC 36951]KAF2171664.1 hypothetical protein M409DRAFT_17901 [Zasmidium cellare ATCC 36951]
MPFSPPSSLAASQHLDRPFLFQPPKSPASVTTTPSSATATDYFSAGSASKKRQRPGSANNHDFPHAINTPHWAQCPTPSDKLFESGFGQDSGLVNEKYLLAGGFDTPSLQTNARLEQLTVPEYEFRRRLRDDDMGGNIPYHSSVFSGPLARERNGVARMPSTPDEVSRATWTGLAVRLVGKVFNFGSNVIRGFYAGDGQGYDMKDCALVGSDLLQEGINRRSTPIPGAWQDNEFLGDFEQDSPEFTDRSPTARPPNKRRQTDRDTWVLVGTPDHEPTTSSPKRKISSNSVPRSNLAQRPSASRASSRRSIAPVPRRANSNIASNGSPAPLSTAPTPTQQPSHGRRASFASTRSPQGRPSINGLGMAHMSPEAERYAKRQAKSDRAAEKAISNMGRRMEDLIRQAQEALGTKVSVEGDMEMEDEGFLDDVW